MPLCKGVIGIGKNPEEALLFARVNQCCSDRGIKNNSISKVTEYIEISSDVEINGGKRASLIIMAIQFAAAYYTYQQSSINGEDNTRGFTESEYKYYSILIKELGSSKFKEIMNCYFGNIPETCIAIKESKNNYRFLF
jgi:hypothetical protein